MNYPSTVQIILERLVNAFHFANAIAYNTYNNIQDAFHHTQTTVQESNSMLP